MPELLTWTRDAPGGGMVAGCSPFLKSKFKNTGFLEMMI